MDAQPQLPERNLSLYLLARFSGAVATQIQSVTIAWEVYDRTKDPLALAWVGLAQFLPLILLSLYAGSFVDRHDRRATLIAGRLAYVVGATGLALLSLRGGRDVWPIYVILVMLGASRAFSWSAGASLLPNLVPESRLSPGHRPVVDLVADRHHRGSGPRRIHSCGRRRRPRPMRFRPC